MPTKSVFVVSTEWSAEERPPALGKVLLYPLPLPRGLVSSYDSPRWVFASYSETGLCTINWDRVLPDGTSLVAPENALFLETAKRFLTVLIENPTGWFSLTGPQTALHRTYVFLAIIEWAVGLGFRSLSRLRWHHWVSFRAKIPNGLRVAIGASEAQGEKPLTDSRILEVFRVVQCSYLFFNHRISGKSLLGDGLTFAPFEQGEDPKEIARSLGMQQGQTPSIPPPIALHCLDAAIQYVYYYADDIIALNSQYLKEIAQPAEKRRTPGGLLKAVKARMLGHLIGHATLPLKSDGKVARGKLARELGIHPSQLSSGDISMILKDFERVLESPGSGECARLIQSLQPESEKASSKARKQRPRDIASRLGLPFSGREGSAAPWPILDVGSSRRIQGTTLERATANLWTACYIVIESMMSDRLGESLSAEVGCVYEAMDGSYMCTPTFKPTNAVAGLVNGRPCPQIVVRAVEVATRLGANARTKMGSTRLFASEHRLGASVIDQTTMRKRLNTFASDVGAPKDEDGEEWHLSPQQFRRFLANAWVWYFELGPGLDALKQHLRQADVRMAVHYAAGDIYTMVTEEQISLTATILERATFDGLDIWGPFGKRWKRLAARINVRIVDYEQIGDTVRGIITSRDMMFYPNPWGYCVWSTKAGLYAECIQKDERRRNLKRPTNRKHADICAKCANCAITKVFAAFWAEAEERHNAVASRTDIPDELSDAARQGSAIARKVRQDLGTAP
jgi:hypothetical protein